MTQPEWKEARRFEDITYHKSEGVARVAFNRPEVRNAFRPQTIVELQEAFRDAGEDTSIGVVLFTGNGPSRDGKYSFSAGGEAPAASAHSHAGRGGCGSGGGCGS